MKKVLLISMLAFAMPFVAHAETLTFPSEAPIASITIPDNWGPKETTSGVEATSEDSAVYLSADVADVVSLEKVISDAIDFLSNNGVTIDAATMRETPVEKFNGMDMATLDWDGKDADGPVSVGLAFFQTSETKALVVTYWGTKSEEDKHSDALAGILASIKPAK